MLDTDICSYIIKQKSKPLLTEMEEKIKQGNKICISVITYAELRVGANKAQQNHIGVKYHRLIGRFCNKINFITKWLIEDADKFASLKAELHSSGKKIEDLDIMIAANALTHNAVFVTNNCKHFRRINSLEIENWLNPPYTRQPR